MPSRTRTVVFCALVIGHGVGAIVFTLGAVYAWLWLITLSVEFFGLTIGMFVLVLSFCGLVRLLRLARQPRFGWYQPWDHGYWIIAERLTSHWWQRPAMDGVD